MENRHPGPEDTENSTNTRSGKAEHVAAWLRRHHDYERHILFANKTEKKDDDEDDEEDAKEGVGKKKTHHLRLGSLTVQGGDAKSEPKVESAEHDQRAELAEDHPAEDAVESSMETDGPVGEAVSGASDLEKDFELWEQELADQGLEVGAADMQMVEGEDDADAEQTYIPQQRSHANAHHQPRRHSASPRTSSLTASNASHAAGSSTPSAVAGGGGGVVPPMPPGGIPAGPSNPNGPNNPNAYNVFNSPNTLVPPGTPNVLTSTNPNKINDHDHEHGHPRLAFWVAAGLLVEHMVGKREDARIEKEGRDRTNKLREQIRRNQTTQEQTRQKMESQQLKLASEQTRQSQVLESIRPRANNLEQPISAGRMERGSVPSARVEAVHHVADSELKQNIEQVTIKASEAEAPSQPKVVMERIAVASELDEPVERVYELRQEVKDEPSNPAGGAAGGAASVGSILAKNAAQHQASHGPQAGQDGSPSGQHQGGGSSHTIDYRAAAIRGIGAGVGVIVLALMAYLML